MDNRSYLHFELLFDSSRDWFNTSCKLFSNDDIEVSWLFLEDKYASFILLRKWYVQSRALYSTQIHKFTVRILLVKVAWFIIVVAVILFTAAVIIFDVASIVAVAVIVPTVAAIVPDFEVYYSCCCCCYYCYFLIATYW